MNGYNLHLLDITLRDILVTINPLREDWAMRFQVINELRDVVQSIDSLRGATVEPFGSFVSNLFTRWGDLDISIELLNGSHISCAGRKAKQRLLGDVMAALRKKGRCHRLQFIAQAKVPILKFQSIYNISCDVSINNLSGQMKSLILFWINEIDGRFRDLVLLIKEWAKAHNINDSKNGSFNSYSLSLLVIFHLQTCVPAIIPPLKDIYPGNMIDDLIGVRAEAENHIRQVCEVHIEKFRSSKSRRINRSSLAELFISFLAKFSDIGMRASSQGINPYTGQWEDIDSNMRWLPKTYALFIEDPFEQPINTARTVSSKQLIEISEAFRTSHQLLTSANQSQTSLISKLVRQHVSRFVARTPVQDQNYYGRPNVGTSTQDHYGRAGVGTSAQDRYGRGIVGTSARDHYGRANVGTWPQVQQTIHSPRPQQLQNTINGASVRIRAPFQQVVHPPKQQQVQIASNGANGSTRSEVQTMHSSNLQQLQNMNINGRSRGSSNTPVQSSNVQGQQAWRPRSDR